MSEPMVKVEQIRLLETKVQHAIQYIERLRSENSSLRTSLETYEKRISDLETVVAEFRDGQEEIEKGIANALRQLDQLEDEVVDSDESEVARRSAAPPRTSPGNSGAQPKGSGAGSTPRAGSRDSDAPSSAQPKARTQQTAMTRSPGQSGGLHAREAAMPVEPRRGTDAARPEAPETEVTFPGKPAPSDNSATPSRPQGEHSEDEAEDVEQAEATKQSESELDIF